MGCSCLEHATVQKSPLDIPQIDGNDSINSSTISSFEFSEPIKVHISCARKTVKAEPRIPVLKRIKRSNLILNALELPVVLNLNPRSIYNKVEDFKLIIEQYQIDVAFISESWERDDLHLDDIIQIEDYKFISTVKKRGFAGVILPY